MRQARAFTLVELTAVLGAIVLLLAVSLPVLGQLRGDDWAAVTRDHLRQYSRAHLMHVADHDYLPPLGYRGSVPGDDTSAWEIEVGVFNTDYNGLYIDVGSAESVMSKFTDTYVGDEEVFTSPADPMLRWIVADHYNRLGNLLVPDEDPQAVGATFTRLWFTQSVSQYPRDYQTEERRIYVEVDGLVESFLLEVQRADVIQSPADCVDLLEEDEESALNNSLFTPESHAWNGYPPSPGENNLITNRHPGEGGHVSFFDGHVELLEDTETRYWQESDYETRLRLLWRTSTLD
jgi:prepilin-type processing-associated H-X9-DG protein